MKIEYSTRKIGKTFADEKAIIKAYGDRAKKIKQRHNELENADNLEIISRIAAARLHPLNGNRNEDWAVDIYKNWRICFQIGNYPLPKLEDGGINLSKVTIIIISSVEDYH